MFNPKWRKNYHDLSGKKWFGFNIKLPLPIGRQTRRQKPSVNPLAKRYQGVAVKEVIVLPAHKTPTSNAVGGMDWFGPVFIMTIVLVALFSNRPSP